MNIRQLDAQFAINHCVPLMQDHWLSLGWDFDLLPDVETYERMQRAGLWFVIGAFIGEKLVGWSSNVVVKTPFNPDVTLCTNELIFALPEHRSGIAGAKLILETETIAKSMGAKIIVWHGSEGSWLDRLGKRGYRKMHVTYSKRL